MAHSISGFIGRLLPLQAALHPFPIAHVIAMPQEYGFTPISHALTELITQACTGAPTPAYVECPGLIPALISWASRLSHQVPLVYIETEYFGGTGQQSALMWQDGQVILGPLLLDTAGANAFTPLPPLTDFPINRVLRRLGVQLAGALDEFEALGLHQHRRNVSWLAQSNV